MLPLRLHWPALALAALLACPAGAQVVGPAHGSLVVAGGGALGPAITGRLLELAGGPDAPVVLIPTAGERNTFDADDREARLLRTAGFRDVTILHTRDRAQANQEAFVAPLRRARAVWFSGGRQWRLVDAYLGTLLEREVRAVLERGGVVGGTSAGATIQGSYLVRGAREGNTLMMAPGYEQGFALLRNVAVDQHLLTRKRERDMVAVVQAHPELLGIGIDEGTALVVRGDEGEVVGASKVAIYDPRRKPEPDGTAWYFLAPGARFDLHARRVR